MARTAKEKDILRLIEIRARIKELTEEEEEIRDILIDDCMEYGTPDKDHANVYYLTIGKSTATLSTIIERRFNTKKFAKENKEEYERYREETTKNKITAITDR